MSENDDALAFREFVGRWQAGLCMDAWRYMGAHVHGADTAWSVWAPNASAVSVVGDFNGWSATASPLVRDAQSGIWRGRMTGAREGMHYAFAVTSRQGQVSMKSDPFARETELRPGHASRIAGPSRWQWHDRAWLEGRADSCPRAIPLSIYEVHATSWCRDAQGRWPDYRALAHRLVAHVKECGFTHVEFMPLMEHWLDESWGYQVHAPFAPTRRLGAPDDLRYLVDILHQQGIGVIFDIVPGHFPADADAWADFDGAPLYEYADPRRGCHAGWGTRVFDYARAEVRSFLLSMAAYWCEEFHADGLRLDAVSSMLYRNYDRHEWEPNHLGGVEHFEAMDVLRQLNERLHTRYPGILLMAEESTAWPGVTASTGQGGLGFGFKWNMGWMNDTLRYVSREPVHRRFHHHELTFSRCYAFAEQFILPLSHDEVVHGKRSLLSRLPGDDWQRFATLRLLYSYLFMHPGKKLLFMGGEWGVTREWDVSQALDWSLLDDHRHAGIKTLVSDLNRLYRHHSALHVEEGDEGCFEWLDADNAEESLIAFRRQSPHESLICLLNFTPVPRTSYRLPVQGAYREIFNSDALEYGGSGMGNGGWLTGDGHTTPAGVGLCLTVPPLAALLLQPVTGGL